MRLANKRGFYIAHSWRFALLTKENDDIRDAFMFENPKEITKERMKEYLEELK